MAGRLSRALLATLRAATTRPEDAAAIRLAKNYAELLDNAAPAGKYAKALEWLARVPTEPNQAQHQLTIMIALAEHSVASDLGPKLLAVLDDLGVTPAARARLSARGAAAAAPPPASPLDELKQRRASRQTSP